MSAFRLEDEAADGAALFVLAIHEDMPSWSHGLGSISLSARITPCPFGGLNVI